MYGEIYIISYDANGTIIDVSTSSLYLDKKETKTTSKPFPRALTAIRISTIMRSYTVDIIQQNKFRSFLDDYKDKGGIIVILPLFY